MKTSKRWAAEAGSLALSLFCSSDVNFSCAFIKDGEFNAKTNVTRSADSTTINFAPFTLSDSTLQFKNIITEAQETTIVHRYLATSNCTIW